MKTRTILRSGLCWISLIASLGICSGQTPDPFGDLQLKYQVASAEIQTAAESEIQRLSDAYVQALTRLEGEFQNAGKLDLLLKVRNEREQFLKSGKSGDDPNPELANLRAILDQNRKPLEEKKAAAVADLSQKYLNQLEALQVELTKTGKIDMAVKVKEAADQIRSGLAQPESVPTTPAATAPPMLIGKKLVAVPVITPQPVSGDPFRTGNWPITLAIPQGNYRFEGSHSIKGEKGRQLLLMPGSQFQGAEETRWVVGNSLVVAKDVSFRRFQFQGDLGSVLHFENCRFEDMIIGKGGPWFGGAFMSRWQMRDCTVSGSFMARWVIKNVGVQIIGGQFERVEFPPIEYESDQEPSEVASHDWATFSGVRFRKCILPASVLSLTDNCEFDDCRFIDAVMDFSRLQPPTHLPCEFRIEGSEILEDDKATHGDPFPQNLSHEVAHSIRRLGESGGVVLRDQAALKIPIRPRSGSRRVVRQRKSWSSSSALGCWKLKTWQPCGLTPDMTWRIAPSLSAASIAWKISNRA